jgi:hypothetical protein
MAIPKASPAQIYADDITALERDMDSIELQFWEPSPLNKLLFTLTPEEHGLLVAVGYSVGPDDASVNGYGHVMFTRLPNPNMYSVIQSNNQTMWNRFFYSKGDQSIEQFARPIYLRKQEPFYIYMVSTYPAGTNILGNFTLYLTPTFR